MRNLIGRSFRKFAVLESASSLLLIGCTLVALFWANSGGRDAYHHLREFRPGFGTSDASLGLSFESFVNDALMAVFFLLVGLEIKRELLGGELASVKRAALPVLAAVGGMIVPAGIFIAWNHGLPGAQGWGIPMATDIAFALGVLMLLGRRIPIGLKVFLVALAIIDDLGAILVIAVFYTGQLHLTYLLGALGVLAGLSLLNRGGVRHPVPYAIGGVLLWMCVFHSGIHATIAGVLLAFCIPFRNPVGGIKNARNTEPLLTRLESRLHPFVSFGILPLFALMNAGVTLSPVVLHQVFEPLGIGILLGLCIGKPVGITLFAWLAVRFGIAALPSGTSWAQLAGAGVLGGIGFTMSIFIAGLGLTGHTLLDGAKVAILCASVVSGASGYLVLRMLERRMPA